MLPIKMIFKWFYKVFLPHHKFECPVAESLHILFPPPSTKGIRNSWEVGVLKGKMKCRKFNWNSRGVGVSYIKSFLWGRYGYVMELHNTTEDVWCKLHRLTRCCWLFTSFCWFRLIALIRILFLLHSDLSEVIMTEF